MFTIRVGDRERDRAAAGAIDTSFETASVFEVVVGARSIELTERALATPRIKTYSMGEAFAPWASWDTSWVAVEEGAVIGFAAVEYEAWHARMVLWSLYVTRARRRQGVGRALLEHVEEHARASGARSIWLETTSANVPGIAAYAALGYHLVGADVTVYETLPYADEAAIYLARRLDPAR